MGHIITGFRDHECWKVSDRKKREREKRIKEKRECATQKEPCRLLMNISHIQSLLYRLIFFLHMISHSVRDHPIFIMETQSQILDISPSSKLSHTTGSHGSCTIISNHIIFISRYKLYSCHQKSGIVMVSWMRVTGVKATRVVLIPEAYSRPTAHLPWSLTHKGNWQSNWCLLASLDFECNKF